MDKEFNILEEDLNKQLENDDELIVRACEREIDTDKSIHYYIAKVGDKSVGF